jgi:uncharacterized protein involved in cysteine biosynthesis
VLSAFGKAIGQLDDRRIIRVVIVGVVLSIVLFAGLAGAVSWLLSETTWFQTGWLERAVDALGGLAVLAVTWFLFPAVTSTTIGFFLEGIAAAVEARHYPRLPPARHQPLAEVVTAGAKFLAVTIALNLAALPLLLVPPVFPFVFFGINGYLLGREYFEVVALRRLPAAEARALRRRYRLRVFAAGAVIALLLTVPFVNLLASVIGTAAMVHLFQGMRSAP